MLAGFGKQVKWHFSMYGCLNPDARGYAKQKLSNTYQLNEKEKKCLLNERIMQVEHGTFTPLVMSETGGMGRESSKFYTRLSELINE